MTRAGRSFCASPIVLGAMSLAPGADAHAGPHVCAHRNVNRHLNRNINVNRGVSANRNVNRHVNVNNNVSRTVHINHRGVVRGCKARPHFATAIGGVVLGSLVTAAAVGVAPVSPNPGVRWYRTAAGRRQGYWNYSESP
jgi:hypothetical protein